MKKQIKNMRVFLKKGSDSDIESEDVSPAGHELKRNKRTAFSICHEAVDFEDNVEFFEMGC